MSQISGNMTFEEIMFAILRDYYAVYCLEPVYPNYMVVDDIAEKYAELRPDHAEKEPQKIQALNDYNGNMVPPLKVGDPFTVLINKKKLLEYLSIGNMTWVGTIIHETTHVRDYTDYAELIGAGDYEDILSIEKNLCFHLWTEFNARAKGYYFVRKYSFENMFDIEQIEYIVDTELPAQEKLLFDNYHQTNDGAQQAYYVSHFLGRLYSLQKIFPSFFTDTWVNSMPLFTVNKWMKDWYWFLKENDTLQSAYSKFDEMRAILKQNFSWM